MWVHTRHVDFSLCSAVLSRLTEAQRPGNRETETLDDIAN